MDLPAVTDINFDPSTIRESDSTFKEQLEALQLRPIEKLTDTTNYFDTGSTFNIDRSTEQRRRKAFELPLPVYHRATIADSTPLQIWEGTVLQVDRAAGVMHVLLNARMGNVPEHTADIDLEWVSDQDDDLICIGAVFYLTLFKQTKRGSIQNSQELRFRRRPSWSQRQLNHIDADSSMLQEKMIALPIAE